MKADNGLELESALSLHRDGTVIALLANPRASRSEIIGLHDGRLKVHLKAPPVAGKANAELFAFVAKLLKVRRQDLSLLSGATGRRKRVLVVGMSPEQVAACIAQRV
jgi:uncharacterized protein (TIGR00251 family)